MEVPAVGAVDRPPVLEALGDDEPCVEDRDHEDDQRQEEGDHGVRLQGALDGDHAEQKAEQIRARVPHEGPGRREAVTQESQRRARGQRRQDAGGVALQGKRDHRQRHPGDRADAGRQPIDAVDQVDDVDHRDDADDGSHLAQVHRPPPREREDFDRARVELAEEGEGEAFHRDPGGDRDDDRDRLAEQLGGGVELEDVVERADGRDQHRPDQHGAGLGVPGQPEKPGGEHGGEDRQAAEARRRRLVERSLVGVVDGADPPGQAVGDGDEEQRDGPRHQEGEDGFDASRHSGRTRGSGTSGPRSAGSGPRCRRHGGRAGA